MALFATQISVSYTHLDVYKRQVISIIYGAQVEEFLLGKRPFYMCEHTAHLCVRPIADDCAEFFRKDGWPSKPCASWLGASFTAVEEHSLTVDL